MPGQKVAFTTQLDPIDDGFFLTDIHDLDATGGLVVGHLSVITDPDYALPRIPQLGFPLWHDYWRFFHATTATPFDMWPANFLFRASALPADEFRYTPLTPSAPSGAKDSGWMAFEFKRFIPAGPGNPASNPGLPTKNGVLDGKAWKVFIKKSGPSVETALEIFLHLSAAADQMTWYATLENLNNNRLLGLKKGDDIIFKAFTGTRLPSAPSGLSYIKIVLDQISSP